MTNKNLEKYLIAYPLFCNSKKFSLRSYLLSNNKTTYKDFRKFLINKSVQPPREEYFNLVKMSVEKDIKKEETIVDNQLKEISEEKKTKKRSYKKRNAKPDEENTNE